MRTLRTSIISLALVLGTGVSAWAQKFNINGIAYNITNSLTREVEVTSGGNYVGDIVEIYDNVVQAVVDFTFGDYVFQSQASTFNDRFVIHKTSGGVTAVENGFCLDGLTVTTTNGGLDFEGSINGKVSVYSDSGMLIAEPTQTGCLELSAGVYIVKIDNKSIKVSVE